MFQINSFFLQTLINTFLFQKFLNRLQINRHIQNKKTTKQQLTKLILFIFGIPMVIMLLIMQTFAK
jgi:hypothetical protein